MSYAFSALRKLESSREKSSPLMFISEEAHQSTIMTSCALVKLAVVTIYLVHQEVGSLTDDVIILGLNNRKPWGFLYCRKLIIYSIKPSSLTTLEADTRSS
jgi:hypothetical protein